MESLMASLTKTHVASNITGGNQKEGTGIVLQTQNLQIENLKKSRFALRCQLNKNCYHWTSSASETKLGCCEAFISAIFLLEGAILFLPSLLILFCNWWISLCRQFSTTLRLTLLERGTIMESACLYFSDFRRLAIAWRIFLGFTSDARPMRKNCEPGCMMMTDWGSSVLFGSSVIGCSAISLLKQNENSKR